MVKGFTVKMNDVDYDILEHREKAICGKYLTLVCVRFFLEKFESNIQRFISEFKRLDVSDEKV